jgi:hypothetical protein
MKVRDTHATELKERGQDALATKRHGPAETEPPALDFQLFR